MLLNEFENKYSYGFNAFPQLIVESESLKILKVNYQFEILTGKNKNDILDKYFIEFIIDENEDIENLIRQAIVDNSNKLIIKLKIKNYTEFFELFFEKIKDESSELLKIIFLPENYHIKENSPFFQSEINENFFDILKFGAFIIDDKKQLIFFDKEFEEIFEVKDSKFELKDIFKTFNEKEKLNLTSYLENNTGEYFIKILNIRLNENTKKTVLLRLYPYVIRKKVLMTIGVIVDITLKMNIIQKLNEKSSFFENVIKNSNNLMFVYNIKENKIIYTNKSFSDLFEMVDNKLNIVEFIVSKIEEKDAENFENFFLNKNKVKNFELILKDKNNKTRFYLIEKSKIFEDNNNLFQYTISEITNFKTEQLLNKTELEKFEFLQNISKTGYWEYDLEKNCFEVSEQIISIFEPTFNSLSYPFNEFIKYIHPEDLDSIVDIFTKQIYTTDNFESVFKIITPNGKVKYISSRSQIFKDNNGKRILKGALSDSTEKYTKFLKLQESNEKFWTLLEESKNEIEILNKEKQNALKSNALKQEFLHNLSHEIRIPLNGIIGFSQLLLDENEPDKLKYFTNLIINSSNQLLKIMDDVLEISRLEAKQTELIEKEININEVLDDLFNTFKLKSKTLNIPLNLQKQISFNDGFVIVDETKLRRIVSNLLDNALKFTNNGKIDIICYLENNFIKISIKDTGIGIPSDKLKTIFERFKKLEDNLNKNTKGFGLGLSIAKENAEILGGEILVESELKKGSCFTLKIPYKPTNSKKFFRHSFSEQKSETINEILIAEDEEINFVYLDLLLKKNFNSLNIIHAKNGKEAVDICSMNKNIKLVMMDLKMPVMNGFDATKNIKQIFPNLPVIAVTAYTSEDDKNKAEEIGFNDYITKPIDKHVIISLVKKYLIVE